MAVKEPSMFELGQTVWKRASDGQWVAWKVESKQPSGRDGYTYKIKDENGKLFQNGELVKEDDLSPASS